MFSTAGLTPLGGAATNPSTNNAYYWTYSDDLWYSRGRHFLKFGTLIEHLRTNKLTATNIRGTYTFPTLTRFMAASPSRFVGVLPGAQLERIRPNTLFGFYAQDDFRMTDRITLNLGLRYEFYTIPKDANGFDSELREHLHGHGVYRRRTVLGEPVAAQHRTSPRLCLGCRTATAGSHCVAAPACITTPTVRSTARSASRTSRHRLRRRRRSTIRRSRSRR